MVAGQVFGGSWAQATTISWILAGTSSRDIRLQATLTVHAGGSRRRACSQRPEDHGWRWRRAGEAVPTTALLRRAARC